MYFVRKQALPNTSCFLLGPRGTGKTMMLRQRFPEALYVDLLDSQQYQRLLANPSRLIEMVDPVPDDSIVIIDEIQKVPELLSVVHLLIERRRGLRFILTGSSARKLRRTVTDLLAGRAIEIRMTPFTADELVVQTEQRTLETMLSFGMIPIVVDSAYPEQTLASYVNLYLREEIMQEGLARRIDIFARFLEAMSFSHGAQLTIANVARECSVPRKTVEGYVQILQDLALGHLLPVFSRRSRRKTVVHPKFYFFDTGLYAHLRPSGALDRPEEIAGAALEGLVYQHLYAWLMRRETDRSALYYWRTRDGREVDFVIYGPRTFHALEVKNSRDIRPKDLRNLKAFLKDYPEARGTVLYRGQDTLRRDEIDIIPVEKFLSDPGYAFEHSS